MTKKKAKGKKGKKRKMRAGGGHAKGAAFERETCVALSMAITNDRRKDLFWRSAMSGGRATVMIRRGSFNKSQVGDITAVDSEGMWFTDRYLIECKHIKDLAIPGWLVNDTGPLRAFLEKLDGQAEQQTKSGLLVAKQNNLPALVLTPQAHINKGLASIDLSPLFRMAGGRYVYTLDHFLARLRAVCRQDKVTRRRLA